MVTALCSSLLPHGPHDIAGGGRCVGWDPRPAGNDPHYHGSEVVSTRQVAADDQPPPPPPPPPLDGWPSPWRDIGSTEMPAGPGLSAGQEIRVRAVEAAARLCAARTTTPLSYLADEILDLAARLTAFIATREGEVSDEDVSAG